MMAVMARTRKEGIAGGVLEAGREDSSNLEPQRRAGLRWT